MVSKIAFRGARGLQHTPTAANALCRNQQFEQIRMVPNVRASRPVGAQPFLFFFMPPTLSVAYRPPPPLKYYVTICGGKGTRKLIIPNVKTSGLGAISSSWWCYSHVSFVFKCSGIKVSPWRFIGPRTLSSKQLHFHKTIYFS